MVTSVVGSRSSTCWRLISGSACEACELGVPLRSVYDYDGSKEGILLAASERGTQRFFADLPEPDGRVGRPADPFAVSW